MGTPIPPEFADFEQLEGLDIIDKAALVGKPFGITAVRFRTNDREVVFSELELVTADGDLCAINDSSTGIRDQVARYLTEKTGEVPPAETGWIEVRLFVPRGLRVSTYEVLVGGQKKQSKTYYLTTQGRRNPHDTTGDAKPPRAERAATTRPVDRSRSEHRTADK